MVAAGLAESMPHPLCAHCLPAGTCRSKTCQTRLRLWGCGGSGAPRGGRTQASSCALQSGAGGALLLPGCAARELAVGSSRLWTTAALLRRHRSFALQHDLALPSLPSHPPVQWLGLHAVARPGRVPGQHGLHVLRHSRKVSSAWRRASNPRCDTASWACRAGRTWVTRARRLRSSNLQAGHQRGHAAAALPAWRTAALTLPCHACPATRAGSPSGGDGCRGRTSWRVEGQPGREGPCLCNRSPLTPSPLATA